MLSIVCSPFNLTNNILSNIVKEMKRESGGKGDADAAISKGGPAQRLRKETECIMETWPDGLWSKY